MALQHKIFSLHQLNSNMKDTFAVFVNEFRSVFNDRGVVIIFIFASLIYPLLYSAIYKNEILVNVPIAAVDCSRSHRSSELLRHIDATQEVNIVSTFATLDEAQEAYNARKVHGVIYIPADFDKKLNTGQQATISAYCDMSSFLYYRAMMLASNYCVLDMSNQVQIERLNAQGITGEEASIISNPIPYDDTILYNGGTGFASFLMPAVLILIIHQTLFFGIGMLAGTSREENHFHVLVNSKLNKGGTYRIIIGKGACYFFIYLAWSFYILGFIPHIFNLPHIGNPIDLLFFLIPFLLATIFFSMTVSVFQPNRETGMILFLFFSLILLFLSGISWPRSNIPGIWQAFGWLFPATNGIQGYVKINTLGADLHHIPFEYISLWIQTGIYFLTTTWAYHWQMNKSRKKAEKKEMEQMELVPNA